ncbi:MAG: hypothetical protein GXP62_17220 [Oligoflexia bacterium]|nr:hypothetical protein [Oligoflexia bacterium]
MRSWPALFTALTLICLSGCGLAHRSLRLLAPTHLVYDPVQDGPPLGNIAYVDPDGQLQHYTTTPYGHGTDLVRPMVVNRDGMLVLSSDRPDTALRIYSRRNGLERSNFTRMIAVTGAREREWTDQVRFLPRTLPTDEPYRLPLRNVDNVYNGLRLRHNDVVLVELERDGMVQRAMFQKRDTGLHFDVDAEVAVRATLSATGPDFESLSPAATLGLVTAYRLSRPTGFVSHLLDQTELVWSIGLGTSALTGAPNSMNLSTTADDVLGGVLWGGGVRLLRLASIQVLGNPGVIAGGNPRWTLAVGVNPWRLHQLTWSFGAKLLHRNDLIDPIPSE